MIVCFKTHALSSYNKMNHSYEENTGCIYCTCYIIMNRTHLDKCAPIGCWPDGYSVLSDTADSKWYCIVGSI